MIKFHWRLLFTVISLIGLSRARNVVFQKPTIHTHNLPLTTQHGRILTGSIGCKILLVESIPQNLTYSLDSPKHASTLFAWQVLLDQVTHNLSLASFYWSLLAEPQFNRSAIHEGRAIYDTLLEKAKQVKLTVAQSGAKKENNELDQLSAAGAQIYWVDVARSLGQGVLHTKLWAIDRKHGYIGSANMDWRSLTEVKELGGLLLNCPELVHELEKIHGAYCLATESIPARWPKELETVYNHTNPLVTKINGVRSRVYVSGSPREFNPPGRTYDLDAILLTIAQAKKYIYISVMDYSPEVVNYDTETPNKYWPAIDTALREAAIDRGVEVRLLISRWPYTVPTMFKYLSSLKALNGIGGSQIRVRYFVVPSFTDEQIMIPHARVNHNKYMVTEKTAYIGTSNWSGDYFLYTGGAGLVIEEDTVDNPFTDSIYDGNKPKTLQAQLTDIFYRDWNSEYSYEE
ncbi:5'-3' exonuclease pld3 [Clonorchis sinensis]|uniref:5'-3' exonuclease pld3 n=1 Tax=Clonorchis sinensis TaxID=79923 RepID=A0A3R7CXL3_CLOSI|nr:5'-3' exonuclease pld3 [Clonorchis sinensis]